MLKPPRRPRLLVRLFALLPALTLPLLFAGAAGCGGHEDGVAIQTQTEEEAQAEFERENELATAPEEVFVD